MTWSYKAQRTPNCGIYCNGEWVFEVPHEALAKDVVRALNNIDGLTAAAEALLGTVFEADHHAVLCLQEAIKKAKEDS